MSLTMHLIFGIVASLLCSGHGKRIQGSREMHLMSSESSHHVSTEFSQEFSDSSRSLAARLLALVPASGFRAAASTAKHQAQKGLQHDVVQPTMRMTKVDGASDTTKLPSQDATDGAGWWGKALALRWLVLGSVTVAASRTGLLSPRMSASASSDASDSISFTAEDKEFFANREIRISRSSKLLEDGVGSILLIMGTVFSLLAANGSFASSYVKFWDKAIGVGPTAWHLTMPVRDWINEALMALFFFLVGMEIKREVLFGSLSSLRKAALPCVAAIGGMVVPTSIYCLVQVMRSSPLSGWAIPMATDIAFAMGIYNLFRSRLPGGAAAFLLTLATVDDLGAIAVIAVAFAGHFNPLFFAGAGVFTLILEIFRRCSVRSSSAYAAGGAGLWYCLLRSGVNADIAGVVAGLLIPAIAAPRRTKATERFPSLLDHYIHVMEGWANFLIMPLFAIANTAVPLAGASGIVRSPVSQGIVAGLLLGKPLGIAGSSLLALKLGWCKWPTGMKPVHLAICGMLGGIAFTMSLFLIEQSLVGQVVSFAKLAVIFGSTAAALIGSAVLKGLPKSFEEGASDGARSR